MRALLFLLLVPVLQANAEPVKVGSKRFTESYILGEILARTAGGEHRAGLGNTAILYEALRSGGIDIYPEYTGTIAREILKTEENLDLEAINARLKGLGLAASVPLGFSNSYALGMRQEKANSTSVTRISDLATRPRLRIGLSHEFLGRRDGWPGLKQAYALPQEPRGLDHGLAYEALAAGELDVIDLYSTDAKIERYRITVLDDDRRYFPAYDAVLLYRADVPERFPEAFAAWRRLERRIDNATMVRLNARAEIDLYSTDAKIERYRITVLDDDRRYFPAYDAVLLYRADVPERFPAAFQAFSKLQNKISAATMVHLNARAEIDQVPFARVAAEFLGSSPAGRRTFWSALFAPDFGRLLAEHLVLVFASLAAAVLIGVPLGTAAARRRWLEQPVLVATGLVQTLPSLALLAFLIPLTGSIGIIPALIALFLYALLPITRNTHAGLTQVPAGLVQAGTALGLTAPRILRHVELPLALPTIMAGIKTSAVINVGTATIAAFIGAGGFGERISQGLALNDHTVLLAGALPAAALALAVHGLFEALERFLWRSPR